ncbi:MAG: nicotinate-nucleotide--dimethylbenzimidazole phosphoribosyltransferase [Desulfarculus sp.]|nr:nicotinate-nucleotide--dimethylbenzimidazole phosphoribosyltransferase [Desulfarculus sp.]
MQRLHQLLAAIPAPDLSLAQAAQERLDNLTKPRGALGRLEELARELCVMKGGLELTQPKAAVTVFAADHGVTSAGVSLYPREVTAQMVFNFLNGGAGINVLARQAGAAVKVVDVGVDFDFADLPGLVQAKVMPGTANMLEGPAMTREQALEAILAGATVAMGLMDQGMDLLIPGDMGIGNTTASAALTAVFCGLAPALVTGRGTGLDDAGLAAKVAVLEKILTRRHPDPADPLGVLAAVGGLEIAAICGYCLAAAGRRVPVILDGFISTSGALVAARLAPTAAHYFIVGHSSQEQGHRAQCQALGKRPLLDLDLRLGEGTGAALALHLVRSAVAIYNEMATFASAGVTGEPEQR